MANPAAYSNRLATASSTDNPTDPSVSNTTVDLESEAFPIPNGTRSRPMSPFSVPSSNRFPSMSRNPLNTFSGNRAANAAASSPTNRSPFTTATDAAVRRPDCSFSTTEMGVLVGCTMPTLSPSEPRSTVIVAAYTRSDRRARTKTGRKHEER